MRPTNRSRCQLKAVGEAARPRQLNQKIIKGRAAEPAFRRVIRAGRGQVGPCLTDEAHRPLPESRPYVSRYAGARTLQQRSLRQILQVESFYLLCSRPAQLLAMAKVVSCHPVCQALLQPNKNPRRCNPGGKSQKPNRPHRRFFCSRQTPWRRSRRGPFSICASVARYRPVPVGGGRQERVWLAFGGMMFSMHSSSAIHLGAQRT
jgi:hypothetical protein